MCDPVARLEYVLPLVQLSHEPPSSLHSKIVPASVAENPNVAAVELVSPDGPESIAVSGGWVSTVQLRTVTGPRLPTLSTARAWNV